MKSIKQRIIDKEINEIEACIDDYNNLIEEDVDYIVEKDPVTASRCLNEHPFLTQEHVDYIFKKCPRYAVMYLSHRLSEENIACFAKEYPDLLKYIFL